MHGNNQCAEKGRGRWFLEPGRWNEGDLRYAAAVSIWARWAFLLGVLLETSCRAYRRVSQVLNAMGTLALKLAYHYGWWKALHLRGGLRLVIASDHHGRGGSPVFGCRDLVCSSCTPLCSPLSLWYPAGSGFFGRSFFWLAVLVHALRAVSGADAVETALLRAQRLVIGRPIAGQKVRADVTLWGRF